jgi:hypothetical protein
MVTRIEGSTRSQTSSAENMVVTVGGPASEVARLQLVLLDQQEDAATSSRRTSRDSAREMRKAQVGELRRAADQQLAAGLTRAAMSAVSAGIDYAVASRGDDASDRRTEAGAHSANATALGNGEQSAGARSEQERTANFQSGAASGIETEAKQLLAGGKALEAGGQALGAVFDHAAADANANATEYGALAEGYQQDAEAAGESASRAARTSERMMEALAQVANARAEAVRNAVA